MFNVLDWRELPDFEHRCRAQSNACGSESDAGIWWRLANAAARDAVKSAPKKPLGRFRLSYWPLYPHARQIESYHDTLEAAQAAWNRVRYERHSTGAARYGNHSITERKGE